MSLCVAPPPTATLLSRTSRLPLRHSSPRQLQQFDCARGATRPPSAWVRQPQLWAPLQRLPGHGRGEGEGESVWTRGRRSIGGTRGGVARASSGGGEEKGAVGVADEGERMSTTQRIMSSLPAGQQAGGAGGQVSYADLQRADAAWRALRTTPPGAPTAPAPQVVKRKPGSCLSAAPSREAGSTGSSDSGGAGGKGAVDVDVAVCGGTLGVFVATSLALRGKRVAIVERGALRGRAQEWNVSRREVQELVALGVLTAGEVEDAIAVAFNPCRCGFAGGEDIWVSDILNLGVSPARLVEAAKQRFVSLGGVLLEGVALASIHVHDDAAVLSFEDPSRPPLTTRLVVDAMGHASPIVRQVRWGQKPDGICLVVGTCARGFPPEANSTGDIICTTGPTITIGQSPLQLFWEAFPSGSGPSDRTTYMFSYMDAQPERPSLEAMLELYWRLMPQYQGIDSIDSVAVQRVLFGFFPTFRDSPLRPAFDRVIQVGDASGIQSPLSFGGFGAITRHLPRITDGLVDALDGDLLSRNALACINPYQPNLSGAWLLQRAMSARVGSSPPPDFINNLLATNFACMQKLGDPVLRPFLQDVTQFAPLALTMGSMVVSRPSLLPTIFLQVGPIPLRDWLLHFTTLAAFSALHQLASALSLSEAVASLPPRQRFFWRRRLEAWEFGSGLDYKL
ncbi:hypothetical protein CLOM_g13381 [Closterium sp. NIES-68]|nr:hypothetical protein CLOM_g13381 [Closterium sp. NIES-68]